MGLPTGRAVYWYGQLSDLGKHAPLPIRTPICRLKAAAWTKKGMRVRDSHQDAQLDANNYQPLTCDYSQGGYTGTGIRTPVPWLRTTCPDP
jgi:hypothetical protein